MNFNMKNIKAAVLDRMWRILMRILPDKPYLKLRYLVVFKHRLNLENPQTLSEKIQWLKLYGCRPEYTMMVDKVLVKNYVRSVIGDEYVIPTLKVWSNPEDIDFESLPDKFVIKANHNSNGIFICRDKSSFDRNAAVEGLKKQLEQDYFLEGRETAYKGMEKKVFAETYMEDSRTGELRDYKFFCFDGEVKFLFIATGRQKYAEPYFDFFDADFNHLELRQGHPNAPVTPSRPVTFDLMKELAAKLSKGIPFVRVDFYEVDGKVYFGEMTFYHFNGFMPFVPGSWDKTFGQWLTLPDKTV